MPFVPPGYATSLYPAFSAPGGDQPPYMMPYMMPPTGVMTAPAPMPPAASQPTQTTGKPSPNKQTPTGAWEYGVEVIYKNTRNEFETDTDASWEMVCGLIHNAVKKEKLDKTKMEILMKVAKESGPAIQISDEEEFNKIQDRIKTKAANARSRAAALEVQITVTGAVSTTKSGGKRARLIPAIGKKNLSDRFARCDEVSLTPEKQLAVVNGMGAVRAQVVRHYARCAVADLHGFAREETPDFEADIAQVMTKKSPGALAGEDNIFDSDSGDDAEKDGVNELKGRDDEGDDIETESEYSEDEVDELEESE
ncbi:hypothetical protein BDN72DRAFT_932703 [Pluteus cervinus]|uniref:Uncharacterized protein n=1 Tax=Pluteus cervinus TaxID=181527 RepID=A0ACD3A9C7_9AGAR|nr:hypothetical protein BDN72DRAFT_932703 [Pluteus cervinus]